MADIGSTSWSETATSNNQTPPNGMPEGQNPSTVNDSVREIMAAAKRQYNRNNPIKTTGGTSTAYTLTYDVAAAAYYDGELVAFVLHATCGATPSLNVNSLGARNLRQWVGSFTTISSGTLLINQVIVARYNASAQTFDIVASSGGSGVPTGTVMDFASASIPDGWLICGGQAYSRTVYAALYAVIGTTYGAGDGSTTFNVPNLSGKVVAGLDNLQGTNAGLLTGTTMSPNGITLGATGGTQTEAAAFSGSGTASVTVPAVAIAGTISTVSQNVNPGSGITVAAYGDQITGTTGSTGASGSAAVTGTTNASTNVQPTMVMTKIIKT